MRPPLARGWALRAALLAAAAALVASCSSPAESQPAGAPGSGASAAARAASSASQDPSTATGWGPTYGDLASARDLVRGWSAEQLAGQVIVGRWQGTDPAEAARLVSDLGLAGVQLTGTNIVDADQVRAVNAAVADSFASSGRDYPPVIAVDQEGGDVAHLAGVAADLPPFSVAGRAVTGPAGEKTVQDAMAAVALELRALGFTWIFAPDADVAPDDGSTFIGGRSASGDAATASRAVVAAVHGYTEAAVACTLKHFPGHGSTTEDSHQVLPRIDTPLPGLRARDLVPFEAGIAAGAPGVMVGHLDVGALDPGVATSMSPAAYGFLRGELHFAGVTITDSLGMGAVMDRTSPATDALKAGADLLLMPADTRVAHAQVAAAIASGDVPRERAEEAASRVIALQRWQQRAAASTPVPADAAAQAADRVGAMVAAAQSADQQAAGASQG